MPVRRAPQTWRLLHLSRASALPCPVCGQIHHYLVRVSAIGDCTPVLFPPGIPAPQRKPTPEIECAAATELSGLVTVAVSVYLPGGTPFVPQLKTNWWAVLS